MDTYVGAFTLYTDPVITGPEAATLRVKIWSEDEGETIVDVPLTIEGGSAAGEIDAHVLQWISLVTMETGVSMSIVLGEP